MRFTHRIASYSLSGFMRHILEERFLVSNKHDVGRFYMTTLVYMSGHLKVDLSLKNKLLILYKVSF